METVLLIVVRSVGTSTKIDEWSELRPEVELKRVLLAGLLNADRQLGLSLDEWSASVCSGL